MSIHSFPNHWILETEHTAYVLGLDPDGRLVNFYWGERLVQPTDYPVECLPQGWASFNDAGQQAREECPAETGLKYIEPCFKAHYADGVRDTVFRFEEAQHNDTELQIQLYDLQESARVVLHYRLHESNDLLERWAEVINAGEDTITLERVLSAQWHLPRAREYRLSHLYGRWADGATGLQRGKTAPWWLMKASIVSSWKKVPSGSGPSTLMGRDILKPRSAGRWLRGLVSQEILLSMTTSFSSETWRDEHLMPFRGRSITPNGEALGDIGRGAGRLP